MVPGIEEAIKWSHPNYLLDGKILLGTAAFKAHAALNFWRGKELTGGGIDGAMGQFGKLTRLDDLPANLDELICEAAQLSAATPAPHKPKSAARPPIALHPDFAAALAANPAAKAILDGFSPSARRDYLEWIAEAKQDPTRARRIVTAIEWLSEGKKRHWKYEDC